MSVEQAIREALLAAAGVTALVGTRIRQVILRQGETLPAVKLQLLDQPVTYHLRGPNGTTQALVQIDAYADAETSEGNAQASAVADAINAALSGKILTLGSPAAITLHGIFRNARRTMYEAGDRRYVRVLQVYKVWSRAA